MTMPSEHWRSIPGYVGSYEVSDMGRVRSLDRRVLNRYGTSSLVCGRALRTYTTSQGYLRINLALGNQKRNFFVHALVLAAFVGPRPDGLQIRHLDGNPLNNTLQNLAYGSASENTRDAVRHGTHPSFQPRTHCKNGHAWIPENIRPWANNRQRCVICQRDYERERSRTRRALKKGNAA